MRNNDLLLLPPTTTTTTTFARFTSRDSISAWHNWISHLPSNRHDPLWNFDWIPTIGSRYIKSIRD